MNVKQLIFLSVAVVALVFVITFAFQYLGGNKVKDPVPIPDKGKPHLVFENPKIDPEKEKPPLKEWHTSGHHDFWFTNTTGSSVQLGLQSMSCKCSKAEVCILPEEKWKALPTEDRALQAESAELTWTPLVEYVKDRKGVTVPAGAAGWVRLRWKSELLGAENLKAFVWTQIPSGEISNPPQELQLPVIFVKPVFCMEEGKLQDPTKIEKEMDEKSVGQLRLGESGKASFLVLSMTRPDFEVNPEASPSPCLTIGKAEKLQEKELAEVSKQMGQPVLCAHRVAVTVQEQAADRRQLDLGLFRYRVSLKTTLKTEEAADAKVDAYVQGEVEGPILVEGGDQGRSRIDVGKFPARYDKVVEIVLYSSNAGLEMKLDGERTRATPFFKVQEPVEIKGAKVGKTWQVDLTIEKETVEGRFPDRSTKEPRPGYDDCAVYLLVRKKAEPGVKNEEPWRRIRIPIGGEATRSR